MRGSGLIDSAKFHGSNGGERKHRKNRGESQCRKDERERIGDGQSAGAPERRRAEIQRTRVDGLGRA